ncbi:FHA domain-containing protein [Pseudoduganella danionis]|uniref:FHA domain-containing protein n=1 Tax=Pseudoduganella danionis TaxID=1890295 RepID=A0ABW9SNK9_9BURK|nr:FHA domain-containing protein [Pseudoduganella danionis]MTW33622.1 FHA domain-containing protein [Pseudoduganella danionis]
MNAPYFVEILARNGDVLHRHRLQQLPIRIGRGYDNDVILDDAHSAASHASIDLDEHGQLLLRDLGSANGSYYGGKRCAAIALDGHRVIRLGHTRLRVRSADFVVAPELADTTMHGWEGAAPAISGLLLASAFALVETWFNDIENFALVRYVLALASCLGAGLLWSGAWGLANRLFGSHARFGRHIFILGSGLCVMGVWRLLSTAMAYAWDATVLTRYGNLVILAIACSMLYFHLRTIKPHHPRRYAIGSGITYAASAMLLLLLNLQSTGRAGDELYMSALLPPQWHQSADRSVDRFMADAAALRNAADAARTRGSSSNDDEDEDSE